MSKIEWNAPGDRKYEYGLDRGVLYVPGKEAVPWNGLISVSEKRSESETRETFVDGVLRRQTRSGSDFALDLEAYYTPREFDECDGVSSVQNGFYATQQDGKEFSLCYRTKIGNDIQGNEHGYRIHIVYNALAVPSEGSYNTTSDSSDASTFKWTLTSRPLDVDNIFPSAHFIIDTTQAYVWAIEAIERILYGTDEDVPRLPTPQEILDIFELNAIFRVVEYPDGTFTVDGPDPAVHMLDNETFQLSWPSVFILADGNYTADSL